jgi:hypothetical protein
VTSAARETSSITVAATNLPKAGTWTANKRCLSGA